MSTIALTLAPPRSRAVARISFQIACAVIGSFLVAGLAQISIHLGFTPVPITGQTLGVLLIGGAYGPGLGAVTLGVYLVWGVIGLPVFAPQPDGSHLTGLHVLTLASLTGSALPAQPETTPAPTIPEAAVDAGKDVVHVLNSAFTKVFEVVAPTVVIIEVTKKNDRCRARFGLSEIDERDEIGG